MYHIPERSKHALVNPWPVAIRRILWGMGILCLIAFLSSFLPWMFDHTVGESKLPFNTASLGSLIPLGAIVAFLVLRNEGTASLDSGEGQMKLVAFNAFLATIAVYFLWEPQNFGVLFYEAAPEAYPYPYRATILVMSTWISIVVTLQMIETVIVALKDARTNVYDDETL